MKLNTDAFDIQTNITTLRAVDLTETKVPYSLAASKLRENLQPGILSLYVAKFSTMELFNAYKPPDTGYGIRDSTS